MSKRTRNLRLATLFAAAVTLAGGLLMGLVMLHGRGQVPAVLLGLFFVVMLAVMFAAMLPWWRRLDHMQRDAHQTSWYWGGSFGGGLGVLLLMLVNGERGQLVMGAVLVWLAQVIGYAAVLAAWKIRHRSGET